MSDCHKISEHENPFPDWTTIAHELGHLIVAWQVTVGSGVAFYPRHPTERAFAEYSRTGVSPSNRVLIAVAGAIGQQEIGRTGRCPPQPSPEEVFLSTPAYVLPEFSGDYETVCEFAPQMTGETKDVILASIGRCRDMMAAVGGVMLIVALGEGILTWLEEDDRARWKEALDAHYSLATVNFVEARVHKRLREVTAADSALAAGCRILIARIDKAIAARAKPVVRR